MFLIVPQTTVSVLAAISFQGSNRNVCIELISPYALQIWGSSGCILQWKQCWLLDFSCHCDCTHHWCVETLLLGYSLWNCPAVWVYVPADENTLYSGSVFLEGFFLKFPRVSFLILKFWLSFQNCHVERMDYWWMERICTDSPLPFLF